MTVRKLLWLAPVRKTVLDFPEPVRDSIFKALAVVERGVKPDCAKPMHGIDSGLFELAIRHRTDAWRVVYAVKIGDDIWIIHAFQKKSKRGISTPANEIDIIRKRLSMIRQMQMKSRS